MISRALVVRAARAARFARVVGIGAAVVAVLGAAAAACGEVTLNATTGGPEGELGDGGARPDTGGLTLLTDGAVILADGAIVPATDAGFCESTGPVISVPGAPSACTGDIGPRTFLFAVCGCRGVEVSGALVTDALSSATGASGKNGGSIGTNGTFSTNSDLLVRGSVWSSQSVDPAVHVLHTGTIAGDVHAAASVVAEQPLTIDGDLFTAGDATGSIACGGALHIPTGKSSTGVSADAGVIHESVTFPPPCDCDHLLDVPTIVSSFATSNDDAVAGISPSALSPATAPLTIGCGHYYFDAIDGGDVSLTITGRAAIFVAGDLHAATKLTIDIAPGAELDLFVGGNLLLGGDASIGASNAPARARIYVGGNTFTMSGTAKIGANLYAPHADVALSSDFTMAGSLFVGSIQLSGSFTIHYDESILDSTGCTPPGAGCSTCHDCAGATPACKGGSCVACAGDTDCCAPLVCRAGKCIPDIR